MNTITNINTSSFTDILDIDLNSVSNHDTIPSSNATKTYVDSQIPTVIVLLIGQHNIQVDQKYIVQIYQD